MAVPFVLIGGKREAVLDYIVERKRLDDLSGSIVDGRYKEQKVNEPISAGNTRLMRRYI